MQKNRGHLFSFLRQDAQMQSLHDKVSKELLESLEKFLDDKIELDDLLIAQEREDLACRYESWDMMKKELKESIFQLAERLFRAVNECEREIKTLEKLNESKSIECDLEEVSSHAQLLSRNRAPPVGFEHSNWYLGPYPAAHMIEMLREGAEEKKQDS
ncbi:uncharacterized protein VICG_00223 [Vittaforma corneae ATCC 50505]|uniref:Uncharacterized protein n=1 Tax=Vittaforma corneae (strain ATCC 50505) TaxID=993615 RepID=L2GPT2_VITCO|nr:uncharacterized protein VICG_00223 [Vittaforma corneae ATCC 50505]ELA42908.1 hypothetical protein VICG_00223 [Vittaforma corneae ATCC 50505]